MAHAEARCGRRPGRRAARFTNRIAAAFGGVLVWPAALLLLSGVVGS